MVESVAFLKLGALGYTGTSPIGSNAKTTWKAFSSAWKFTNGKDVQKPVPSSCLFISCHQWFPWCLLDKWALLLEEHPSPQRAYQSSIAAATIPSTDRLSAASGLCLHKHEIFWGQKKKKKKQVYKKKRMDLPLPLKLRAPHLVFSQVRLFLTLWTISHQAPLSLGFSRQEHSIRLPFPFLGDLPDPGIESASLATSALAGRCHTVGSPGKPIMLRVIPSKPPKALDWNQMESKSVFGSVGDIFQCKRGNGSQRSFITYG